MLQFNARSLIDHAHRREVDALASIAIFTGSNPATVEPFAKSLAPLRDAALSGLGALYAELCRTRSIAPRRAGALEPKDGPEARLVPFRTETVKGPIDVYYFDYLATRLSPEEAQTDLSGEAAYEVLNYVDGKKSVREIRDAVSAELGAVPLSSVLTYLRTLEKAEVVTLREPARR